MAKKKARADGEGTIFQRHGRWIAEISLGIDSRGRRIRRRRVRDRRSDAVAALKELRNETAMPSSSPTVAEFLTIWLRDTVAQLGSHTQVSYRRQIDNHIAPCLGKIRLKKLNALQVESMVAQIDGDCTKRYAFRVLRTALNRAVRLGLIPANPCNLATPPTHTSRKADPFTQAEVKLILDETAETNFGVVYQLAFGLGMRYGEIMGLHWSDVDFEAGTIFVHQQLITANGVKPKFTKPKTESSIRTLQCPSGVLDALHDRRSIMLRDGQAREQRVVCGPQGGVMWPQTFWRRQWQPLLEKLEIRHRGFHQCRHTYATLQLRAGQPVHIVSKILGHTKPAMTLNVYSHLLEGDGQSAAESIQKLLG